MSTTDRKDSDPTPEPRMPKNFSWVVENKLAAMGMPSEESNIAYLTQHGVTRLITLMEDWEPDTTRFPEIHKIAVKVVDFTPPTLEQIKLCIDYIEESLESNKSVGIHCAHGKGRTGTVISCYLVKHLKLDPDDAIKQLRSIRPGSVETPEQEEMVRRFSKALLGGTL